MPGSDAARDDAVGTQVNEAQSRDSNSNGLLTQSDQEFIGDLIRQAEEFERHSGYRREVVRECFKFALNVATVYELMQAFRKADGKIDGKDGVRDQLGLEQRYSVYCRIEALGLQADDFRNSRYTLKTIIEKSPVIGRFRSEVLNNGR
jgi:hypothetical protein